MRNGDEDGSGRVATRTGTQAIERAAELLVRVVDSESPPTVGDLAEQSGLPKSTTSRLVAALERQGLVQRDAARGGRARRAGARALRAPRATRARPARARRPGLDRLAALSGETVNLGVATPEAVEQLDQRDSRHYLGSTNWVGRRVPLHASALGKVFLAYGAVSLPAGPLERLAPRTIVDRRSARARARDGAGARLATAVDELEPGLWAVAAPVFETRRRRSSPRSPSPARPSACTTACSTTSGARCARRRRRSPPASATTTRREVPHDRRGDRPQLPHRRRARRADARRPLRRARRRDRRGDEHPARARLVRRQGPQRRARRGHAHRRDRLPRRHPVRPGGAARRQRDEGRHGDPPPACSRRPGPSGWARS